MQSKDLQTKERITRKHFHSKSAINTGILGDLRTFSSSAKRNDIPNKYKTLSVPLDHLESVIAQNSLPKFDNLPQTSMAKIMSEALLSKKSQDIQPKAFYYSNRNEILSFEEFFNIYHSTELRRKQAQKQQLREKIAVKRQKLSEIRTHTIARKDSLPSPPINLEISSSSVLDTRPLSCTVSPGLANTSAQPGSGFVVTNASSPPAQIGLSYNSDSTRHTNIRNNCCIPNLKEFEKISPFEQRMGTLQVEEQDDNMVSERLGTSLNVKNIHAKHSFRNPINITNNYCSSDSKLQPSSFSHRKMSENINVKEDFHDCQKTLNSQKTRAVSLNEIRKSNKQIAEQKLTDREIVKQLAHLIVTPMKLKRDLKTVQFEKRYAKVYKSVETIDREIGLSLQRLEPQPNDVSVDTMPTIEQLTNRSSRPAVSLRASHPRLSFREHINQTGNTLNSLQRQSTKQEDNYNNKLLATTITETIREIDGLLKHNIQRPSSPKPTSENIQVKPFSPTRSSPKKPLQLLLANKIPLRKDIAKKYNTGAAMTRNLNLSERVKQINALVRKQSQQDNAISYSTTKYVDYYIT